MLLNSGIANIAVKIRADK